MAEPLFSSFFLGGFECSTHRRPDGRRLDLLESTGHAHQTLADYRQLANHGIRSVRDGVRWHLVERRPGVYDWSSVLPMVRAARSCGTQVIWDLCHYGWPEHLDIWQPAFVDAFGRFAAAFARLLREEGIEAPLYCPVNEISYWAWAGGDVGRMNPCCRGSGGPLKEQLVRSAIAAIEAVWAVEPGARIVHAEPAIHVAHAPGRPGDAGRADAYRRSQWEAWDMLSGRLRPELGGRPEYLDVLGLNYYPENQWFLEGPTIPFGHHEYRPLRELLAEVHARYARPLFIAETGAEGSARSAWLHYVHEEVTVARCRGVPVEGVCIYPVLEYPGWDNDRPCSVGLLGNDMVDGRRTLHEPLAAEIRRLGREVRMAQ